VFRKNVLGVAAGALVVGAAWTTLVAFDPQPDPPAFGVISITKWGRYLHFHLTH
jgi:hypothetical protein